MKRIDKIYYYLEENTKKLTREELINDIGFTSVKIAEELNMLRNNVSKELNELLRVHKIIKIKERPVRFLHKKTLESILGIKIEDDLIEVRSVNDIIMKNEKKEPFKLLIGSEKSLKNQIEQAKAAILYPPIGLNTLIIGQTGVGKTLFAKLMHNYGKFVGRFPENSPFIVFNCADYYNNSQLLLAHIFGYVKGAFTGADSEKQGLVEKADGGILFLDEIHRLPPEGQEMIFYFMDTGQYNKMGESERTRKSNVFIICATTEDTDSYMLKTFMRRIPITINIPSLQDRTNEEKVEIITHLFLNEAHRVNKSIKVTAEVVKALIGSATYGNIGQLKSNIQLTCAKGFLDCISNNKEVIELEFKNLSPNIKDGFFEIGRDRREFQKLDSIINKPLAINPDGYKVLVEGEDPYEPPFNLYKIIEDKLGLLKEEGMDDEYINKFITTDVNIHIKSFYNKFSRNNENKERILKIVDKETLEFAEEVKTLAEVELNRKYSDRFVYAFSLHISSFFKRIKEKKYEKKQSYSTVNNSDKEYSVAIKIKDLISERFGVKVPEVEVTYISILLKSIEEERDGNVGILVAAHGNSTASSMVNVVKSLLGNSNIGAVDMPLDVSPKDILEIVINKVKEMDSGRGVLLLVDMGSLVKFEATIIERTGIKVRSIDMVSTPLILEAVRKSSILDIDLEDIYNSLKDFRGYTNYLNEKEYVENKVIITVCSSGKGTAEKLKEMVDRIIVDLTGEYIKIIPVSARELDKKISELKKNYSILMVIGIKKPAEKIPFISLEKLMDSKGEKMLKELLVNNNLDVINEDCGIVIKDLCENSLQEFLTYLNPRKAIGVLMEFVSTIEKELHIELSNKVKIAIINHSAYALERMLINNSLRYENDKEIFDKKIISSVSNAAKVFKRTLNISLTEDEKYYICEMISSKVSKICL
ncbi:sigma 54-interacting transcriptional regulator [Clostridium sp. 'White wine YQ']|uniref:sigma 54-interacting transcriptional regulator n=1 Tax=Clostridium sp. 'White wine YQ' TaxID=3027474 RepID=UPI002365EE69|nr:sigma-54-dependent transcriptional regulator [Clostridium sp. 'White wine YQ']MDD7794714.1 sigma 54-interacting transcriptional regulator [Clostridium sp. 'White wine YQ']